MNDHEIFKLFINRWGFDATIYVAAWSLIGLGFGCIIGYSTKHIFIHEEKE